MIHKQHNIFSRAYLKLFKSLGPRHWWPAKTTFEIMVGAILTQNTSWKNVEKAMLALGRAGKLQPQKMAKTAEHDLAAMIRSSGYYNQKARKLKAFLHWFRGYGYSIGKVKAAFPSDDWDSLRQELLGIYGIGRETADSILCYALELPYFVVDAYTFRWIGRYAPQMATDNYEVLRKRVESDFLACFSKQELVQCFNEFHAQLVYLGKHFCIKSSPRCIQCPIRKSCRQNVF